MPVNPHGGWEQQPFAGSGWISNGDAAFARGYMMRNRMLPSWLAPLTPEQARRVYRRHQFRRIYYVILFGLLGGLMAIAALTLVLSQPVNALVGLGISTLILFAAVRQYRKFSRWQHASPEDFVRAKYPERGVQGTEGGHQHEEDSSW